MIFAEDSEKSMGKRIFLKVFMGIRGKRVRITAAYFIAVRAEVVKGKEIISFVDILLNFLLF
jgi:hypothetical protein